MHEPYIIYKWSLNDILELYDISYIWRMNPISKANIFLVTKSNKMATIVITEKAKKIILYSKVLTFGWSFPSSLPSFHYLSSYYLSRIFRIFYGFTYLCVPSLISYQALRSFKNRSMVFVLPLHRVISTLCG